MKYLINGGCGFLGSNMAEYYLNTGDEVIVFDNLYRFGSEKNLEWLQSLDKNFRFIKGDVRNIYEIEKVIKEIKPDIIFHFAGQVAMTTSIENPYLDFEVNVKGTFNVLESVRKYSPDSIICFSSTNKVYGDLEYVKYEERKTRYEALDHPSGFNEKVPLDFHSPYGCSKGAADQYMLDYARVFGLKTIVFRHSSIFGGRQFATFDQGWVGWFCQKAYEIKNNISKEPFTISGDGKQVRDILFSSDLIECYRLAIKNIEKTKGQAFNVGGGYNNSYSLIELFNELEKELNIKMNYKKLSWRESDQKVFIANINKAEEYFGWKPKIEKQEGIKKMYDWIEKINYKYSK
ncbi:NAD-dependent epimerase/dehydratase family protein [Fusobacterium varium]|uniref:NAD-dependent epimerase/dehydratase family protein n=1 Tax=Fusobacterium varium TaxID=856 RepID=UPI000E485F0A|nr:NAD-dependent epimerase/dehydratase family protein [Fusobacterium varium]RHG32321.1 NAD-dependent epimerase/dehydratase family protein [Fusobacterium varium]